MEAGCAVALGVAVVFGYGVVGAAPRGVAVVFGYARWWLTWWCAEGVAVLYRIR